MHELQLRKEPFDPQALVAALTDRLRESAHNKGLRLDVVSHGVLPHRLLGDAQQIGVIIDHLAGNAIKFTHRGHVRIETDYQADQSGTGTLTLNVLDTGIGVPESAVAHLFEEFTQADDQPTRRYGGTGIGLALCHRLVEAMDGRIGAERRSGGGSLFWVTLPLAIAPDTPAEST
jgi:signal transduction histidine kinase